MQNVHLKIFLPIVILLFPQTIFSQIALGKWRDHFSYYQGMKVTEGDDKIYCMTQGGLIYYNKKDATVNKFSKVHGLSDFGFSTIYYHKNLGILMIGYTNGNIDIVEKNRIVNIPDIKLKQIAADKAIHSITFYGNDAYLSCGFGIVVVNLEKHEIKDTYRFGAGGTDIYVNATAVNDTLIFAATKSGVYKACVNDPNLIDFNKWERITELENYSYCFDLAVAFKSKIYINYAGNPTDPNADPDKIHVFDGQQWLPVLTGLTRNYSFEACSENLIVTGNNGVNIVDERGAIIQNIQTGRAQNGILDDENTLWIADNGRGLVRIAGAQQKDLTPNGPNLNRAYHIQIQDNIVYTLAGSRTGGWNNTWTLLRINKFQDAVWSTTMNYYVADAIRVKIDPQNTNHLFIATWGYGVLEYMNDELLNHYDVHNQEIHTLQTNIENRNYVRISGIDMDEDRNLWVTNWGVPKPVSVMKASDNTWKSFDYNIANEYVGDILLAAGGNKWALLTRGKGLFVFNEHDIDNDEDDVYARFNVKNEEGEIVSNDVHCIVEDLDENIWVGTNKGPVIYYYPHDILDEENPDPRCSQIIIPRNDDTPYGDVLLGYSRINCIAIDGANRKWFGTEKSGAFLISEDGMDELHHFTVDNSPLPSDKIQYIAIDHQSGEVFFATGNGVVSFRGEATKGTDDFGKVYVFPNPVRENYTGDIVITGLAQNATVKITDISGNIVYETKALGGQALWDGRNFRGQRVHTGVYLVFCTNEDASKTAMTKLLFIN